MKEIELYLDIDGEIEIYEKRINDLNFELKKLRKMAQNNCPKIPSGIEYSGMPKGSPKSYDINEIGNNILRISNQISEIQEIIDNKKNTAKAIEESIKLLKGVHKQVAVKRFLYGKQLKEIADELGYSEKYIRKVSSQLNKSNIANLF